MSKKFRIETRYLGEKIDLKKLQGGFKKYNFLNRDHPLVVELVDREYAVLTKFGAVSFWNVEKPLAQRFLNELAHYVRNPRKDEYVDTLEVHIVPGEAERATFEELYIKRLDVEKMKIISYVSAQSVALDRYEEEIDRRLEELGKVVEGLKTSGKTRFNPKSLIQQVGQTLSVKQNTVASLSLLDKPEATWEREEIERLYDRLRDAYELRDRFDILNEKIDFLSENNTTLLNYISSQKANFLEIIVIVLIVIEIVLFLLELLRIFPG